MRTETMWQTTQLFLSTDGVQEVSVNIDSHKLRCTCDGYEVRRACKHTRFVKQRMEENGGIYPTEVSTRASRIEAVAASQDPELFRKLLINYGKIEVL